MQLDYLHSFLGRLIIATAQMSSVEQTHTEKIEFAYRFLFQMMMARKARREGGTDETKTAEDEKVGMHFDLS